MVLLAGSAAGPTATPPAASAPLTRALPVFPDDNYWHADVSDLPRHSRSKQWLTRMSPESTLHPDFGPSYGDGPELRHADHRRRAQPPQVRVRFEYADESDRVRYPFGRDTPIEGGRGSPGDRHAIVVDRTHLPTLRDLRTPA